MNATEQYAKDTIARAYPKNIGGVAWGMDKYEVLCYAIYGEKSAESEFGFFSVNFCNKRGIRKEELNAIGFNTIEEVLMYVRDLSDIAGARF